MPFTMDQPVMGSAAPTTAATAAAAPSTTGNGTYYAPNPGAAQAAEDYTTAQQAYTNALARFNQQRGGLLTSYGYKGTVDPTTGMIGNLGVDTHSSVGQLQQLLHSAANEDQNAQYAAQDRGIFGGLANQGLTDLRFQHQADSSNLANTLLSNLSDLDSQQQDAKTTLDQALWQLQHTAVNNDISTGSDNPAGTGDTTPGLGTVPATVSGTPNGKDASGNAKVVNPVGSKVVQSAKTPDQAMDAMYGLGKYAKNQKATKVASTVANAYLTNKNKRG